VTVKTLAAKPQGHNLVLGSDENPFSTNKVTGHSLNFPIIGTCMPSVVCADTCYFAKGPSTWSASLAKQHRLLNSLRVGPRRLAHKIVRNARRLKLTFIRWNGGGDCVEVGEGELAVDVTVDAPKKTRLRARCGSVAGPRGTSVE
jgi:hypothetical protein